MKRRVLSAFARIERPAAWGLMVGGQEVEDDKGSAP